jgi:hypothetical protein
MPTIGPYKVTSSNPVISKTRGVSYPSYVRIVKEGVELACVRSEKGNLWHRVRKYAQAPERHELMRQLHVAGVSQADVEMLFKL